MVSVGGVEDFGDYTIEYLGDLKDRKGVMMAVCTPHYGEKTSSPYSSYAELRFALDEGITVLPLKVADIYPPEPPGGPGTLLTKRTGQRTCAGWFFGAQSFTTWTVSTSPRKRSR